MQIQSPNRSPNAAAGITDVRTDFVYGSLVVTHAAQGTGSMFTVGRGSPIPSIGTGVPVAAHHIRHGEHSTNIQEAGRIGSAIGDVTAAAIAIDIEQAVPQFVPGSEGTYSLYGATGQEVAEILNKCYFILKIGQKEMTKAPVRVFPALGGVVGALGNTTNNSMVGFASNGPGIRAGRQLRQRIRIDRTDAIEGVFGVAPSATLAFRTVAGAGQETLVTCFIDCGVASDVR